MRWALLGALLAACGGSSSSTGSGDSGVGGSLFGGGGGGGAGGVGATGGGVGCVPNQQIACACGLGELGYQICRPDGSSFYDCVCSDAGAGGSGGLGGNGGSAAVGGGGCAQSSKYCGGVCVAPAPSNGCSLTTCAACTAPAHAGSVCNGFDCDFVCDAGYAKVGGGCVSSGGGGSGGTGGAGGSGGTGGAGGSGGVSCNPLTCPTPPLPAVKCCVPGGSCGLDYNQGAGCQSWTPTGGAGGGGGTGGASCNPGLCPTPAPPAIKCCVTSNGPCGIDFSQGAGCQVWSATGGTGGVGGTGGSGGNPVGCPTSKPTNGAPCTLGIACTYGTAQCICFTNWFCNG